MNAIDEMGNQVGVVRGSQESDLAYGTRVLETTYRTHQACHGFQWTSDREENDTEQWAAKGEFRAFVWHTKTAWWFTVYHHPSGATLLHGQTRNVDQARQLCSLALSEV